MSITPALYDVYKRPLGQQAPELWHLLAEGVNSEQTYQVAESAGEFGDLVDGQETVVCYAGTTAQADDHEIF